MSPLASLAAAWWSWMAPMAVQVALLAACVALLEATLLRSTWPQLRGALWLLVVLKLAVPPGAGSPVVAASLDGGSAAPLPALAAEAALPWCLLWLAGAVVLTVLAVVRQVRTRQRWLRGPHVPLPAGFEEVLARAAAQLGLRRSPRVVARAGVRGPAVVGALRPTVVLPAALVCGDPTRLHHVLLHELAHLRRRDPLVDLLGVAAQIVYWFHPAVWLARRRLATLREICCDLQAAQALRDPRAYRRTLLEMARPLAEGAGALAFVHRQSLILARLAWLERPPAARAGPRRGATAFCCAALVACVVPVAAPITPLSAPSCLGELRGCLQLRFAVLQALAARQTEAAGASASSSPVRSE